MATSASSNVQSAILNRKIKLKLVLYVCIKGCVVWWNASKVYAGHYRDTLTLYMWVWVCDTLCVLVYCEHEMFILQKLDEEWSWNYPLPKDIVHVQRSVYMGMSLIGWLIWKRWGLGRKWYDIIIGPIGRGDPLGKPTRGHKRRNWVERSCITCKNSDGESSSYIILWDLQEVLQHSLQCGSKVHLHIRDFSTPIVLRDDLPDMCITLCEGHPPKMFLWMIEGMFWYSATCALMTTMEHWYWVLSSYSWHAAGAAGREGEARDHATLAQCLWIIYPLAH